MTVPTSPSWYDVLGVDDDASPEQIRTAWRDGIADLDPTDRRFRLLNQAAEVLLDERAKSAYDADLAPAEATPERAAPQSPTDTPPQREPRPPTTRLSGRRPRRSRGASAVLTAGPAPEPTPGASTSDPTPATPRRGASSWVLVPLALVTAALVAVAVYLGTQPSDDSVASRTEDAQSAAERAVPTILAYDYRHLDADQRAVDALLTPSYADKYDALFAQIKANAADLKPVVTATVLASGIVRSGADRVQVLVFVNRPTTRADGAQEVFHDQVRVTMVHSADGWLVDDLKSTSAGS